MRFVKRHHIVQLNQLPSYNYQETTNFFKSKICFFKLPDKLVALSAEFEYSTDASNTARQVLHFIFEGFHTYFANKKVFLKLNLQRAYHQISFFNRSQTKHLRLSTESRKSLTKTMHTNGFHIPIYVKHRATQYIRHQKTVIS